MRLDAHVHTPDTGIIPRLRRYVANERITHFVAISSDVSVADAQADVGARPFLFHRLKQPLLADDRTGTGDRRVAGYKFHLRHPVTLRTDGRPVSICEQDLGRFCRAAGHFGRPMLFHTDADEPKICTLPMLAQLACCYPDTPMIAAHLGLYAQEVQGSCTNQPWSSQVAAALAENVQLLLDVRNLYAETALLGRDFPQRTSNPSCKLDCLARIVAGLTPVARKALLDKLFIGTDFPCFWEPDNPEAGYGYQLQCMRTIFAGDLDENRMVHNFLKLVA